MSLVRYLRLFIILISVHAALPLWAQDYVPGELIVKLKGKSSSTKNSQFMGKIGGQGLSLKASYGKLNMHHFALKKNENMQAKLQELRQDPSVEFAEPNYILKKADDGQVGMLSMPTYLEDLVGELSGGQNYIQNSASVQVEGMWQNMTSLSTNPERPIVAIIDSGVDRSHYVFTQSGALWVNPNEIAGNGIDDDNNGYIDDINGWNFVSNTANPDDDDGHGTHVAGIVLGVGLDITSTTITTAPMRLMILKFLDSTGSGTTSNAIRAINYAVNNGAKILNNSWGGGSYSQALHEAVTYSYQQKSLFLAAAGNSANNNDVSPLYPASLDAPHIVSVAATNDWDYLASFSNYGLTKVTLAAPGVSILSTLPGSKFGYSSGTSMATPFVSGVAVMMLREASDLTGYQLKEALMSSVDSLSNLNGYMVTAGRLNAKTAINKAMGDSATLAYQPDYTMVPPTSSSQRSVASEQAGSAGGCGLVSKVAYDITKSGGKGSGPMGLIVALTLLPLIIWQVLRLRKPKNKRRYERFVMHSQVKVNVAGKELIGEVNTISVGGMSFNADAMLENGGIVKMNISSPDGNEQVEVQGQVVWSEANKAYGVQFAENKQTAIAAIGRWTKLLVKAS